MVDFISEKIIENCLEYVSDKRTRKVLKELEQIRSDVNALRSELRDKHLKSAVLIIEDASRCENANNAMKCIEMAWNHLMEASVSYNASPQMASFFFEFLKSCVCSSILDGVESLSITQPTYVMIFPLKKYAESYFDKKLIEKKDLYKVEAQKMQTSLIGMSLCYYHLGEKWNCAHYLDLYLGQYASLLKIKKHIISLIKGDIKALLIPTLIDKIFKYVGSDLEVIVCDGTIEQLGDMIVENKWKISDFPNYAIIKSELSNE